MPSSGLLGFVACVLWEPFGCLRELPRAPESAPGGHQEPLRALLGTCRVPGRAPGRSQGALSDSWEGFPGSREAPQAPPQAPGSSPRHPGGSREGSRGLLVTSRGALGSSRELPEAPKRLPERAREDKSTQATNPSSPDDDKEDQISKKSASQTSLFRNTAPAHNLRGPTRPF